MSTVLKQILSGIRVELAEEYDRNFERKAFFDQPWEQRRIAHNRGTLMALTGRLRRSYMASDFPGGIKFSSDTPYASIHHTGGSIPVTPKMRKYFWAMYYKSGGRGKKGTPTAQAQAWRSLALTRKSTFTIPRRQVIGNHPKVDAIVGRVAAQEIERWADKNVLQALKPRK